MGATLWDQVLQSAKPTQELTQTVIMFGASQSGKTALQKKLQGVSGDLVRMNVDQLRQTLARQAPSAFTTKELEEMDADQMREELRNRTRSGIAFEYGHIPVKNPVNLGAEEVSQYNVWICNGVHENMESPFEVMGNIDLVGQGKLKQKPATMVLVVVDLSKPYIALQQAVDWLTTARKFVKNSGTFEEYEALVETQKLYFNIFKQTTGFKETPDEEFAKQMKMDELALSKAVGLPTIIVGTKSDTLRGMNQDLLDLLQKELRDIAYVHGAALMYTSAEVYEDSTDTLLEYMNHRMFGFDGKLQQELEENERIFIPFGWDSTAKINATYNGTKMFSEAFPRPREDVLTSRGKAGHENATKKPKDHQAFLKGLQTKRTERIEGRANEERAKIEEREAIINMGRMDY